VAVYQRSTRVRAPLEDVWAFHSRIEGLLALTPSWVHLRVDAIEGADAPDDGGCQGVDLPEGTTIRLSVRPFGVGPRQQTASRIEYRHRGDGAAVFRDRMVEGPLERWLHTHAFYADGGGTVVRDRVEYELPGGSAGRLAARLGPVGLAPLFRYRHRRTRELLEGTHAGAADSLEE